MVKTGEILQYLLEATTGVGVIRIESTDNHIQWNTEVTVTGTVASPITSELGRITNESGRDRIYRFHAVTIGATSTEWSCTLTKQPKPAFTIKDNILILVDNDAPVGGADGDGAGYAGAGSLYIDTAVGAIYRNEGTAAMTNWASL